MSTNHRHYFPHLTPPPPMMGGFSSGGLENRGSAVSVVLYAFITVLMTFAHFHGQGRVRKQKNPQYLSEVTEYLNVLLTVN